MGRGRAAVLINGTYQLDRNKNKEGKSDTDK